VNHEVCPRPQLVRAGWTDLGGAWDFALDHNDRGVVDGRPGGAGRYDRTITVPYPPESSLSGIHDHDPHPVVWYRRSITVPARERASRVLLHFGAVDHSASVWVNGVLVGGHDGGQSPFHFDVTDALDATSPAQTVVVRAEDRLDDGTQPRGKQDWRTEPHDIWYHRTTGIWQPVWLEVVPALHLAALHWTPDVTRASVTCEGELSRPVDRPVNVGVRLRHGDELVAVQTVLVDRRRFRFDIAVPGLRHGQDRWRLLWSPEHPTLLDATVDVSLDGSIVDSVTSYVGLRDVGTEDGRFLLNHQPYYLRMVLQQGYWPQSHLAAPDADALRREVELIKELGFNGVRVHQKAEDPRFLYWCDRLGLLVWGETANAYEFAPAAVHSLTEEWLALLDRDRSHPSIVTWVPLNESWGVPDIARSPEQMHFSEALYHLTKSVDPSRLVIGNDGWENTTTDIHGVHDYAPTGSSLRDRFGDEAAVTHALGRGRPGGRRMVLNGERDPRRPVMLTEFGGLSFAPASGEKWFGYSAVADEDELLRRLDELVSAVLDSPVLAGFCYTQLTDTEQERNGLLTADRTPKIPPAALHAILNRAAAAIPAEEVSASRRAATERRAEPAPEPESAQEPWPTPSPSSAPSSAPWTKPASN
jgi:hypothetical protein